MRFVRRCGDFLGAESEFWVLKVTSFAPGRMTMVGDRSAGDLW